MKVLFVCAGNTCRSPMAAGIAESLAHERGLILQVRTGGLAHHPGRRVAALAVSVLSELGIDISHEFSKPVTPENIAWADTVVPMEARHAEFLEEQYPSVVPKLESLECDIQDPQGRGLAAYVECRDLLVRMLPRLSFWKTCK
jgi:protein arginine phosphatase